MAAATVGLDELFPAMMSVDETSAPKRGARVVLPEAIFERQRVGWD
jgi:hypothetical protein